ncbi:MAG: SMP-30/gluconolactonase/LRE family protein [Bacteroidales bacterium]|jgi:gluconolactonase|nr:SMP-30/gluconolactonase/LRE family protein [Bacteroidales bacterium]
MKKKIFAFGLSCIVLSFAASGQHKQVTASGARVEKLAEGFAFTEGPAVDRQGNVYFTDQPNNRIHIWSVDGRLSVFHENSGRANGLYFDRNGCLLSCSDMDNELWSIDGDGSHTVLVADFAGKRLNGPNDLWVHPKGGVYFTDPLYRRSYWTRDAAMQQDGEHVYFLSPDRRLTVRAAAGLKKPNGIVGAPDGKRLYVADIGENKTYVYDIQPDGSLSNRRLFAPLGSDGMTIDRKGNVYLTGRGVTVFNSKGEQIEHIPVEAGWTANVCFGGKDMKTLFITASQYLFAVRMDVKGVRQTSRQRW